jgi:hypothetical protein
MTSLGLQPVETCHRMDSLLSDPSPSFAPSSLRSLLATIVYTRPSEEATMHLQLDTACYCDMISPYSERIDVTQSRLDLWLSSLAVSARCQLRNGRTTCRTPSSICASTRNSTASASASKGS